MYDPEQITYFAETDARNKRVPFGIKAKDRTRHVYVIGKTAMGKSTLLENMAIQDLRNGNGMCFIDPHTSLLLILIFLLRLMLWRMLDMIRDTWWFLV